MRILSWIPSRDSHGATSWSGLLTDRCLRERNRSITVAAQNAMHCVAQLRPIRQHGHPADDRSWREVREGASSRPPRASNSGASRIRGRSCAGSTSANIVRSRTALELDPGETQSIDDCSTAGSAKPKTISGGRVEHARIAALKRPADSARAGSATTLPWESRGGCRTAR